MSDTEVCKRGLLNIYAACARQAVRDIERYEAQQQKEKTQKRKHKPCYATYVPYKDYESAKWWLSEIFPQIKWIFDVSSNKGFIDVYTLSNNKRYGGGFSSS